MFRSLNKYQKCLLFLMIGLFVQFYTIPLFGSHLKIYMVFCIILVPFLDKITTNGNCFFYEKIWLFSFIYLAISIMWASNVSLGFQLILGEFILITFYFVLKNLFDQLTLHQVDSVFQISFKFFIYTSSILYIFALLSIFVFHNESLFLVELNETSQGILGCYRENVIIRFMGIAESPNNYAYFANIVFWYFIWKKQRFDSVLTLITLILTLSTTLYVAFAIQCLLYYYMGGKLNIQILFLCAVLVYGIDYIMQFSEVQTMVETRMVRNSTGSGRFELWDFTLNKISESPIWGYGLNQSRTLFTEREYMSSHNNILEMGLSLGYMGCIVYILFLFSLLKKTFTYAKKFHVPLIAQISIAFFVFGLANNTLHIEYTVFAISILAFYMRKLTYN